MSDFIFFDLDQSGSTDLEFNTQGFGAFRGSTINPQSGRIALRPDSSLAPLILGQEISSSVITGMGLTWGGPRNYDVGTWNSDTDIHTGVIAEGQPLYLGFQFSREGNTYNGWLSVNEAVVLQEIAYNIIPNGPIAVGQVPEPGITMLMLMGIAVLSGTGYVRKKRC